MTKTRVALSAFVVGVPVLLFFQNCAKSGAAGLTSVAAFGAVATTDSLVLNAPTASGNDINLDSPTGSDNVGGGKESLGRCDHLVISDILLNVASVSSEAENINARSYEIQDNDRSLSLDKLTLNLKAMKSANVKSLTLALNAVGNKILTTDNTVIELKPLGDKQTIIKIVLAKSADVVAGRNYKLVLAVNPVDLVISNKNSCVLKPLIQSAALTEL